MTKKVVFYFSTTGNSRAVAENIANAIEADIFAIKDLIEQEVLDFSKYKQVGIICPVYSFAIPKIVERFVKKISLDSDCYLFNVLTYGGVAGAPNRYLRKCLKKVHAIKKFAGWSIIMPDNYTPLKTAPTIKEQNKILTKADNQLPAIIEQIKLEDVGCHGDSNIILRGLTLFITPLFKYFSGSLDRFFKVRRSCNLCGICKKVCPVGNIQINDKKVCFSHKCEQCMACLQWCPKESIQMTRITKNRRRYHHPNYQAKDFFSD